MRGERRGNGDSVPRGLEATVGQSSTRKLLVGGMVGTEAGQKGGLGVAHRLYDRL